VESEKKKRTSGATRVRTWVSGNLNFKIPSDNHYTIAPTTLHIEIVVMDGGYTRKGNIILV
jgi:hypothetical protein